MIVRVKLFAAARELAGAGEVPVEIAMGAAISDVEMALRTKCPELNAILSHARWSVDATFVSPERPVNENSEVALIPPVSGG